MMKKYYIYLILLFVSLIPIKVSAVACTNENKVRLSSLASNVKTSYVYEEKNDTVVFKIILSNINEDLIVYDVSHNKSYNYSGSEIVIEDFNPNTSYRFDFYSDKYLCSNMVVYSKYVTLPAYNKYYKDSLCEGIENYKYCLKWQNVTLSYDEFKVATTNYKNSLVKEEDNDEKYVRGIYDVIIGFYASYYFIILPLIIITCIVIIVRNNKKNDLF